MKEIVNLIMEVLFIPIPLPISFSEDPMYFNLFGLFAVSFAIYICWIVISRLYGAEGDDD